MSMILFVEIPEGWKKGHERCRKKHQFGGMSLCCAQTDRFCLNWESRCHRCSIVPVLSASSCSKPSIILPALHWLAPLCPCLSFTGEPRTRLSMTDVFHQCRVAGKDHLPPPDGNASLLMQPRVLLAFAARTLCWLMISFLSRKSPSFFSAQLCQILNKMGKG